MYPALYEYLLLYGELPLPGMGRLTLQRSSAASDFASRSFSPPLYTCQFVAGEVVLTEGFRAALTAFLPEQGAQALPAFEALCRELKSGLEKGAVLQWDGVGELRKGLGDEWKFTPSPLPVFQQPVVAEKVLRENASHRVRVGEDDRSSEEMTAFLQQTDARSSRWWIMALLLFVAAAGFITWYYGFQEAPMPDTGNRQTVPVESFDTGYRPLNP